MKDLDPTKSTKVCPHCGGSEATTIITERYELLINFDGVPFGQANNTIVSGGKRFICDSCGKDVSKHIKKPEVLS